ncbi:reverse transcriptase family protein [Salmonella enterica subsp. enterica serovar Derby]|nr:reverse transcriptase family protein [Salmonella enterica subsp. enterica serovar Derby]
MAPIHKAGSATDQATSYRPISLLSLLGKILERLLARHLRKFLDDNRIIQNEQFGFMPHHSTTQQLLRINEFVTEGFGRRMKTAIIFLDVEKAFDRLWINGLLAKCILADMPTWLTAILKSFLTNRKFQVRVNTNLSETKPTRAGVPQGSVLGPILFTLYMSDLKAPEPTKLALYADDAAFYAIEHNNFSRQS